MPEVLDQNEIDSLLNALDSGNIDVEEMKEESDAERIKKYDFRRPNKLSKEQMHTLQMINENLARIITTTFSTRLRSMVNFEVASIEQLSYSEFIHSLPEPTVIGISQMEPLQGQFFCEINPDIAFTIIDRLFGGLGKPMDKTRDFTDIEQVILKKVLNWILDGMAGAWENILEIRPYLQSIESNPQFTQIVPDNDMTIIITLSAGIAKSEGLINICIPYIMIEPIASKLSAQQWFASSRKEQTAEHIRQLKKRLKRAPMEVFAELGKTNLKLSDVLYLDKGDVIKLDKKVEEKIDIRIGNKIKFKAVAGKKNRHKAFKVTGVTADREEVNNSE